MQALILTLTLLCSAADKAAAEEYLRLGNEFLEAGEAERAIEQYQKAQSIYPSPRLHFNLGQAHEEAGRPLAALEAYQKFVEGMQALPDRIDDDLRLKIESAKTRIQELRQEQSPTDTGLISPSLAPRPNVQESAPALLLSPREVVTESPKARQTTSTLKWWIGGLGVVAAGAAITWYVVDRSGRSKGPGPCITTFCFNGSM